MLYIVSGTSRSGKTKIAREILQRRQIPYLSLDWIVMGFTNGMPQLGIHDKLFPDEIAERVWDFLKAMFESMIWQEGDYVIEGEALLPELIRPLLDQHPAAIRVCFVGYTRIAVEEKVAQIKAYPESGPDWLVKESDDYIYDHVQNMVSHSQKIESSCAQHDLRYFDTSEHFLAAIEEATEYLLGSSKN